MLSREEEEDSKNQNFNLIDLKIENSRLLFRIAKQNMHLRDDIPLKKFVDSQLITKIYSLSVTCARPAYRCCQSIESHQSMPTENQYA